MRRALPSLALAVALSACGVPQEIYNTRVRELDRCAADLTRVQGDLSATQRNADELATETSDLRDRLTTIESERAKQNRALASQAQNLELFKSVATLAERRAELWQRLDEKLRPLVERKQLTFETGKGRMVLRIPEATLFDQGHAELKSGAAPLLHELAAVMKQINRDVLVTSHSDNQPLATKGSPFKSAWELTLARSVALVRYFQGLGVDPRRLGAAGFSEFKFVTDNVDDASREKNRRVELVIIPADDELLPLPPEHRGAKRVVPPPPAPAPPGSPAR